MTNLTLLNRITPLSYKIVIMQVSKYRSVHKTDGTYRHVAHIITTRW